MTPDRATRAATAIVAVTGALWGLYWIPVRTLSERGLAGAWGTLAIVAAGALVLALVAVPRRRLRQADRGAVLALLLGGAAFAFYSVSFVYGRVAIVVLLFFLTPVWSVLIGRVVMGWPAPVLRLVAIAIGLAGLAVMLGAGGTVPVPRGVGEWLGVIAGLLWSVATVGMRVRPAPAPLEAAFVFALGACLGAVALLLVLPPLPGGPGRADILPALGVAFLAGGVWWSGVMVALTWAVARLDPARVGILLMGEVLVAALSAAWLAGNERLSPQEIIGGALVLLAGLLEVWPVRARR